MIKKEIINNIEITTDENGNQHFKILDLNNDNIQLKNKRSESFWQKIKNWWNNSNAQPYIKVRDLGDPLNNRKNNPLDQNAGSDGKKGIEIGIKFDF